jgi:hypothetical protein
MMDAKQTVSKDTRNNQGLMQPLQPKYITLIHICVHNAVTKVGQVRHSLQAQHMLGHKIKEYEAQT